MRAFGWLLLLLLGIAGGSWLEQRLELSARIAAAWRMRSPAALFDPPAALEPSVPGGETGPAAKSKRKILYYRHPMGLPDISPVPKKDEMGMDYVPVYEEAAGGGDPAGTIRIAPEVVQNLGVRAVHPQRGLLEYRVNTFGNIDVDESRIGHVHIRTQGWIERLAVNSIGAPVKAGELLFELYSPELVTAQEEYLQALAVGHERVIGASRARLLSLGVTEAQIARLDRTRKAEHSVPIVSHHSGVLTELKVREGMYVEPDTEAMTLTDLSSVYLIAEVLERESAWTKVGQPAEARLPSRPGRVWKGNVDLIYPALETSTRTLRLRMRFDNPDEVMRPNMFAEVTIVSRAEQPSLTVPREALIREGRGDRVVVALGEGRFAQRPVVAGLESGGRIEILDGLTEADEVVASGQFLLDAEASLQASFRRMEPPAHAQDAQPAPARETVIENSSAAKARERSPALEDRSAHGDHP